MERRLKERLVGAAILVVLIVVLVPELLSGPKPGNKASPTLELPPGESHSERTRTVLVDLNTQRTMAPEAPAESAGTAGAAQPEPPPSTPPLSAAPPPSPPPPPLRVAPPPAVALQTAPATSVAPAPAMPSTSPAAASWSLQLGVFANRANAEQLVRTVKAHDSPAFLSVSGTGKQARWRVKVGPLANRAAADRMLAKLKSEGHAASVVAP